MITNEEVIYLKGVVDDFYRPASRLESTLLAVQELPCFTEIHSESSLSTIGDASVILSLCQDLVISLREKHEELESLMNGIIVREDGDHFPRKI